MARRQLCSLKMLTPGGLYSAWNITELKKNNYSYFVNLFLLHLIKPLVCHPSLAKKHSVNTVMFFYEYIIIGYTVWNNV